MSCSMEIIRFYEECEREELKKKIKKSNPTHPLYSHWTESQELTYRYTVSKWLYADDYNYLSAHEPMMPFVYKLSFNEFLVQLESDKNSMSHQEVFEKYTGETYLV